MKDPRELQANYYHNSANKYDEYHLSGNDPEHDIYLFFLSSIVNLFDCQTILDVGAGTGRAMLMLNERHPNTSIYGIEPVGSLREIGYSKGISRDRLMPGDGYKINYPNDSFDIVCAFGILHHVESPDKVIEEMVRVSKIGVFISDSNNFGQGSSLSRTFKIFLRTLGLWSAFNYVRTGGKKYQLSETDGLFYSYSVFTNYSLMRRCCDDIFCFNIDGKNGINPLINSRHVALFGKKKGN